MVANLGFLQDFIFLFSQEYSLLNQIGGYCEKVFQYSICLIVNYLQYREFEILLKAHSRFTMIDRSELLSPLSLCSVEFLIS